MMEKKGAIMMKRKKIITVCFVVLILFCNFLEAKAVTTLQVPYYKQEKSNWCWAATSRMTGKYLYPASSVSQTQIVQHVKGSVVNRPATVYETVDATEYVTNDAINFAEVRAPLSFASVKTYINAGIPIQPLVNDGSSGHYYVIYGYNETSSGNYLYLVDPWDAYGKYVSYDDFLNGTWEEDRPWIESVA